MTYVDDNLAEQNLAINFLKGKGKDNSGRNIDSYFDMNDIQMENDHQWVQNAFPIDTVSPHNPDAPRLFGYLNISKHFRTNSNAYKNQSALVEMYCGSIGIHGLDNEYPIVDYIRFYESIPHMFNHHVKRISRLLKHLKMTKNDYTMHKIYKLIMTTIVRTNPTHFHQSTLAYWSAIVNGFDDQMVGMV